MARQAADPDSQYQLLIGGEARDAVEGGTLTTINPSTEEDIARVPAGTAADVDDAVESARDALGEWNGVEPRERGRLLRDIADQIREEKERLAELESLNNGKTLSETRAEVDTCVAYFEYYAGITDKVHGESIPRTNEYVDYTVREPLGVFGLIIPWNFPIQIFGRAVSVALATGNTAVVKPAEQTPVTAIELGKIIAETAVPDGAVNIVTGYGAEAGAALAGHPDVDGVSFTGSVATGRTVAQTAAEHITPVHLELGGKSPAVVYPDADVDETIDDILTAIFETSSGQCCAAGSRLLVHEDVHDQFVEKLADAVGELTVGPGIGDPDVGAIVSEEQLEKVVEYLEVGREENGEPVVGGNRLDGPGFFVEPTIFADVDNACRIAQEEIFGPILSTVTFSEEDEAIEIANDTEYGLVAGIFTNDQGRAHRFARDVDAGQVFINEWFAEGVDTPFGGYKKSGYGREKGLEAVRQFTQVKNVCARIE